MDIESAFGMGDLLGNVMDGLGQTVEPYSGEGVYVQVDPWYYRSNDGWTYNQCTPFQWVNAPSGRGRRCPAGYEPAGQSVCGSRWIRQTDGSYLEAPPLFYGSYDQNCANTRANECSGCRPIGAGYQSQFYPNTSYGYRVCDYQGGAKPAEEVQREYLVTQALRNGLLSARNCRNLSVCDGSGRPASYMRSCSFYLQNGQSVTFDTAAAYAAQFFNIPAQLIQQPV